MAEEISKKRLNLIMRIVDEIVHVYNAASYDGWTGDQGAYFAYTIWFRYGAGENDIFSLKGTWQLEPIYEQFKQQGKTNWTFEEILMTATCKFGANHMYVAQNAKRIVQMLERESGLHMDD